MIAGSIKAEMFACVIYRNSVSIVVHCLFYGALPEFFYVIFFDLIGPEKEIGTPKTGIVLSYSSRNNDISQEIM